MTSRQYANLCPRHVMWRDCPPGCTAKEQLAEIDAELQRYFRSSEYMLNLSRKQRAYAEQQAS